MNRHWSGVPRLLAAAVMSAAAMLAANGGGTGHAASPLKGTISFMAAEYSTKTLPFWQSTIKGFEQKYPGIKVKLQMIGWQDNHDTTVRLIAANQLPDLVNTATIWLPEWVGSGAIRTVGSDLMSKKLQSDFFPTFLNKGARYKGQNWGIPCCAATRALFYNKSLFTAAGIKNPPKTWSQMYNDVVSIHSKTGKFGYAFDGSGVQAFRYFGFFLWNAGGDFFTKSGKAAFNSKAGVDALNFLIKLVKSGGAPDPTAMTIADVEPLFQAGRLGMMIDGSYEAALLKGANPSLNFGASLVPVSSPKVKPVTWGVTDVFIISKKANATLIKPFIDYFFSPKMHAQFDINEGNLPLTRSEAKLKPFQTPLQRSFIKSLSSARFDPQNPNYSKMQELVKTAMQKAIKGQATAKAALDEAASTFNSEIGG
ncbi:MAG: sugar ABC transporter substrate-binding protein [Chloroflexi bacterium]|nr:sugar ABC transporter substrate-binding protein [Chloroflexota bacterium]